LNELASILTYQRTEKVNRRCKYKKFRAIAQKSLRTIAHKFTMLPI